MSIGKLIASGLALSAISRRPGPSAAAQIFPNLVEGGKVDLTSHTSARFLWYGWSSPEPDFRWTASNEATVIFAVEKPVDLA